MATHDRDESTDDDLDSFEAGLRKLRPHSITDGLRQRIADALASNAAGVAIHQPPPLADRVLAGFVACAAMAACVIVGVFAWERSNAPVARPSPSPPDAARPTENPRSIAAYSAALRNSDIDKLWRH